MMRLALILGLVAPALGAQSVPYSDAGTVQCLSQGGSYAARLACAGVSARLCMNTPEGNSTVGMGGCLGGELAFWDAMLNSNYKTVMAEAKRMDAGRLPAKQSLPGSAVALRDMQRAWITFRDKACAFEGTRWGGGSGQGPATVGCLMQQTARQALDLQTFGD